MYLFQKAVFLEMYSEEHYTKCFSFPQSFCVRITLSTDDPTLPSKDSGFRFGYWEAPSEEACRT